MAATPVNLELLARQGFTVDAAGLGPSDLVLCVRAADEEAADQALEQVEALLAGGRARRRARGGGSGGVAAPRSLRAAARRDPDLNLAVLSVPGRHLHYEIAEALQAGLHVFCFSDGLDPATEAARKRDAARRGLLLMGPDCGTAILDGVGLGFANAVRRGPVGVVGASGTGIQEVTCLLDAAGVGISHAIGVGGRDLSPEVGGIMTLRALDLLAADDATERLVVISKPPDPRVARLVADAAATTGKPAVLAFPGPGGAAASPDGVSFAGSLEAAAAWAVGGGRVSRRGGSWRRRPGACGRPTRRRPLPEGGAPQGGGVGEPPTPGRLADPPPAVTPGAIRGLFCGGTLCYEAMAVVAGVVGRVASNIPLRPEWRLADPHRSEGHTFVDFGDDATDRGPGPPDDRPRAAERAPPAGGGRPRDRGGAAGRGPRLRRPPRPGRRAGAPGRAGPGRPAGRAVGGGVAVRRRRRPPGPGRPGGHPARGRGPGHPVHRPGRPAWPWPPPDSRERGGRPRRRGRAAGWTAVAGRSRTRRPVRLGRPPTRPGRRRGP